MKIKIILFLVALFASIAGARAQQDQTQKFLTRAVELIDKHDYENAIVMCTYAIKSDSSFCDAFYLRGLCFSRIGNQNAALRDLDFSVKLNSLQCEVFLLRSKVNQNLGNLKESVADLNKARKLDPVGTTIHLAQRFLKSILP